MRIVGFFLILLLTAGQTFAFIGASQEHIETKELSDLPGMSIEGPKYMIGAYEAKGVKGIAYLNDLRREMAKYGLKNTHHLMVEFKDIFTGESKEIGSVAVKVKKPQGMTGRAIKLLDMEGGFGADVTLKEKGTYQFTVGTELSDGVKRTFLFNFKNK